MSRPPLERPVQVADAVIDVRQAEVLFAETSGGQQFAFHDATADLGHFVELYEPSERLLGSYAFVAAAAAGWQRDEPVRAAG